MSNGADRASDFAAGLLLAAPFALDYVDVRRAGGDRRAFASDAVVILEAVALDKGVNQLVKAVVHRPRPFLYGLPAGDPAYQESENYRSFYSGHASTVFAASISCARTLALRHPQSPYRWKVYGAAILGGGTVGVLRIAAGKHFPTDVMASAAAGSAAGLLVPALHRRGASTAFSVSPYRDGARLRVSLALQ